MSILTVNVGSSSLKLAIYETKNLNRKAALAVERVGSTGARLIVKRSDRIFEHKIEAKDVASAIDDVFQRVPELFASGFDTIGHRVVTEGEITPSRRPLHRVCCMNYANWDISIPRTCRSRCR